MSCEVEMAVDGSCLGNPGPGGWACILRYGESERVLQGGVPQATNNRMEMTAAIEGLRALKRPCEVRVFTDSEYLLRGMTQFLERWQSNGWRSASGNGVANQDLWEALAELASYHRVTWVHVGGNSGHSDQERCDRLAARAAREARQSLPMEASVGRRPHPLLERSALNVKARRIERRFLVMNAINCVPMNVTPLLTLEELGLDRRVTVEEASRGLAQAAEAEIVRWVQFPAGVLFFTLVSGDPESGALYVFDRKTGVFYWINFEDQKWGGYSIEDYRVLVRQHKLTALAQRPALLERRCRLAAQA